MTKNLFQKTHSRNFLGTRKIDWKNDKKQIIKKLLENEGCFETENNVKQIKGFIMEILELCKRDKLPEINSLNIIYNSMDEIDHFDCVRIDQIITRIYNTRETEHQWASICMNKKFKTL